MVLRNNPIITCWLRKNIDKGNFFKYLENKM